MPIPLVLVETSKKFNAALLISLGTKGERVILRAAQPDFRVHPSQACAEIGRFGAARKPALSLSKRIS